MRKVKPKLPGLDIGGNYNTTVDADGKTRIVADEAATLRKLAVNQRIARRKSKRIRFKPATCINKPI